MPLADPEARKAYMRDYNVRNRDKRHARAKIDWQNRDHEHQRNLRRRRRYGISAEDFDRLFVEQGGVCAVCRIKPPVDVDHCHSTGAVRGLLCRGCNVGLGQLGDSVEGLQRAIDYLRKE